MIIDYFKIPEIKVTYKDKAKTSERLKIQSSFDVIRVFREAFKDCMQHHEEVYALFLNHGGSVLGISNISKSGVTTTLVDIRIILQTALKVHATGIILSHNHPSSVINPSQEDLNLTKRLLEACKLMDIKLLDHIIMTSEKYYSFSDEGRIL